MNTNTKFWGMTWETNVAQKKIPEAAELISILNKFCAEATFQYEIGSIKQKEHIQGVFTLEGPRRSKIGTLSLFREHYKNVSGLTITPVYDRVAINAYVTKPEGRVKGPFYAGKNMSFDKQMAETPLRHWQKNLFDLLTSDELPKLKDRKVIWLEDKTGNTGKSWFRKWLDVGQKRLNVKPLPISNVDRLMSAVNIISKTNKVDVYTIDLTRTQGEDESLKDLFSAIEQIKNGYVVDVMYGKFNRAIFDPPVVIIFTNEELLDYHKFLSEDRWLHLKIEKNELIRIQLEKYPYKTIVGERIKSSSGQVGSDQSLDEEIFEY